MLKIISTVKYNTGRSFGLRNTTRLRSFAVIGDWYKELPEIVEIVQGLVRGAEETHSKGFTFYSFQGIPFGKAPISGLRFKPPVKADPWRVIRDCTKPPNDAIANHIYKKNQIVGDEDCLFLNVYTQEFRQASHLQNNLLQKFVVDCSEEIPRGDVKILKPVMLWVHGGRFMEGSSKRSVYGPELLVSKDVVLVTTNYRLGILGCLSVNDPMHYATGNACAKDVILALKWIRENVDKFGGDPGNVTVFGGSAGAAIVHSLLLSPLAAGLFHRAILQSGSMLNPWSIVSRQTAADIVNLLGNKATDDLSILEFLRSVPANKLLEAQGNLPISRSNPNIRFGLVIEPPSKRALISEDPLHIIKSGNYNKVPLMIGYNSREGYFSEVLQNALFGKFSVDNYVTRIPIQVRLKKDPELAKKVLSIIVEAYFKNGTPSMENVDDYFKLETDYWFLNGIYQSVQHHLKNLQKPIYFYKLAADTKRNYFKVMTHITRPGVCHGDEIGYLFQSKLLPELAEGSLEEKIVERVLTLWTNFAKYGSPNGKDKSANIMWKRVEKDNFHCMTIGEELTCCENTDLDRIKIWKHISEVAGIEKY